MKRPAMMAIITALVLMVAAAPVMGQHGSCRLQFTMLNSTRHVVGEVNTECSWPRIPFGNWGVESGLSGRTNTYQFAGWKWTDDLWQWNSCTSEYVREANCYDHYNHDHNGNGLCEDQGSNAEYGYAWFYVTRQVSCPYDWNGDHICDSGGCLDIAQYFSVGNQYLDLWEIDDFDFDDYIGRVTVHSGCCSVSFTCNAYGCSGGAYSPTYATVAYSPSSLNTTANVRMKFEGGSFIDGSGEEACAYWRRFNPHYICH